MSRILDFIIGIFTFSDPTASAAFYFALILIPALTWILGKKSPQVGSRIMHMVMRVVAIVLGVAGFILLFIIASSSKDVDFTKGVKIDGQAVDSLDVRGQADPIIVYEGSFYVPKASVSEEVRDQNIKNNPEKYAMVHERYVERVDEPDLNIITTAYLANGSSKKIVNGEHWDQDTVGTSINLSLIIVFICFGLMLGYGLSALIENPRKAKNPLIVLGGLILVFLIGYGMESSFFTDLNQQTVDKMASNGEIVTKADEQDAGGGIMVTIVMISIATLTILAFGIINFVKMRK